DRELPAARAAQHEEPLARAGEDLDLLRGAAGDRRHDVDLVARGNRALRRGPLVVQEEGDVGPQGAALVEHPAGEPRMGPLQLAQRLAHGRAGYLDLLSPAGQVA